jgi:aspartate aminotransferase
MFHENLLSSRLRAMTESVTLSLNSKVVKLAEEGEKVYNLTAGQLPFKPDLVFIEELRKQTNFLKSYQYSPVAGFEETKKKFVDHVYQHRKLQTYPKENLHCCISTGAKQAIFNAFAALINPGDEVILLAPFWLSYSEMVKVWEGQPIIVKSDLSMKFEPLIEDIERVIGPQTKMIVLNSPNNPTGIHYCAKWMKDFAQMLLKYPQIIVLSDEIYSEIYYYDPKPQFFYQFDESLLERTLIIDGLSKSFASTGLRIGYVLGNQTIINAINKIQGQSTSGANSLIQRAIMDYPLERLHEFLTPIKQHLGLNASTLKKILLENGLSHLWYQTYSAFYFIFDLSKTRLANKIPAGEDQAAFLCEEILHQVKVAMVPTSDFGFPNGARISLVAETDIFAEAITKLVGYLVADNSSVFS